MALSKDTIRELYLKRAEWYDISANLFYLIGFREAKYRKMAVSQLYLKPGDTVVEIGCGTGLNFPLIREYLGDTGHLIGVDLTDAMLEKARSKIHVNNWKNVSLIQSDAARYAFPEMTNGVLSSFALTLVPEYQSIIEQAAQSLVDGGRFVLLDFKRPEKWPLWIVKLGVMITRPFGVTLDLAERKPWEVMRNCFHKVTITDFYGGFVYIAVGEKKSLSDNPAYENVYQREVDNS